MAIMLGSRSKYVEFYYYDYLDYGGHELVCVSGIWLSGTI